VGGRGDERIDRPDVAALALSLRRPSDLAETAGAGNDRAGLGVACDEIGEGGTRVSSDRSRPASRANVGSSTTATGTVKASPWYVIAVPCSSLRTSTGRAVGTASVWRRGRGWNFNDVRRM
jgi:hypothetical protein